MEWDKKWANAKKLMRKTKKKVIYNKNKANINI